VAIERVLRAAALTLVAAALWRTLAPREAGRTVHVAFRGAPAPFVRDSLRAQMHSGTPVRWSAEGLDPLAVSVERQREPGSPVRIAVVAPGATELRDALGVLDTVHGAGVLAGVEPSGAVTAVHGRVRAIVNVGAPAELRPVLVVGRATWEAKFAVAALEEQGWSVHARLSVAPAAVVTQGGVLALDTANYAAVVALDTTLGALGSRLERYVRSGGGLVLVADAANAGAVRVLAPARAGMRRSAVSRDPSVAAPLDALPLFALESLRGDAVPIATRGALTAAAARREGDGRVLQLGYGESWRWRMQGGDGAVAAHREWWSRVVGSVAFAPGDAVRAARETGALVPGAAPSASAAEGAPLARLIGALGPPVAAAEDSIPARRLPPWLLPTLLAILLGEWASRRFRGAR
jgi:hypothetical protein